MRRRPPCLRKFHRPPKTSQTPQPLLFQDLSTAMPLRRNAHYSIKTSSSAVLLPADAKSPCRAAVVVMMMVGVDMMSGCRKRPSTLSYATNLATPRTRCTRGQPLPCMHTQHSTAQHRAARTQNCGLRDSRHSLCLCGHRCHHHYHH